MTTLRKMIDGEYADLTPEEIAAQPPPPTLAEQLAAAKKDAIDRVNREAGEQRAAHITVTTGQEGTYIAKQAEAERWQAGGAGPFPYLDAEAEATNSSVSDVAALVLATAAAWTMLNAGIEGRRRGALVAIDAAQSIEAVEAAFPIAWPA
jgi:hypothetical protein